MSLFASAPSLTEPSSAEHPTIATQTNGTAQARVIGRKLDPAALDCNPGLERAKSFLDGILSRIVYVLRA